ncbi:hypothetical protein [Bradymonas sediminis]|uniref:Uncharacterized protein n=1 Tax=Bradymonas sediminis TaxID=1548548 RepID=A0A2Z4FLH7_9DELT|nr:hypothetical protein [Bradymonas sediminis]AWV89801.1 hypothetical protein DN745_10810 [Bradymonas sediminis]TDP76452.1 hypothetical protein DFR33_10281 [Bradymonas sediminis]
MKSPKASIQCTTNLLHYFREELKVALDRVGLQSSENTEAYLVYLLQSFVRIDPVLREDLGFQRAAGLMLGDAMNQPGELKIEAYRRLGDASLFNCGFFDAHLTRRGAVTSQYYRNIGRIAYGQLSDLLLVKRSGEIFHQIYEELSAKFDRFVDALQWLGRESKPAGREFDKPGPAPFESEQDVLDPLEKLRRGEHLNFEDLKRAGWIVGADHKKN